MRKIKQIIKNWLFKEELEDIFDLQSAVIENRRHIANLSQSNTKLIEDSKNIKEKFTNIKNTFDLQNIRNINSTNDLIIANNNTKKSNELIASMLDIGVDIHEYSDSWAVVCIAGKSEYVQFARLDGRNARDVLSFLNQFENANKIIVDAPYGMMETFNW